MIIFLKYLFNCVFASLKYKSAALRRPTKSSGPEAWGRVTPFSDASSHLYKKVRPSVCPSRFRKKQGKLIFLSK